MLEGSSPSPGATALSSRGLGRRPLTAVTRVRIPLGLNVQSRAEVRGSFSLIDGAGGSNMPTNPMRCAHRAAMLALTVVIAAMTSAPSYAADDRTTTAVDTVMHRAMKIYTLKGAIVQV